MRPLQDSGVLPHLAVHYLHVRNSLQSKLVRPHPAIQETAAKSSAATVVRASVAQSKSRLAITAVAPMRKRMLSGRDANSSILNMVAKSAAIPPNGNSGESSTTLVASSLLSNNSTVNGSNNTVAPVKTCQASVLPEPSPNPASDLTAPGVRANNREGAARRSPKLRYGAASLETCFT